MNKFSSDVDVLRYEPSVFTGASFFGPVLCRGSSGQVSGTTFSAAGESFLSKQVQAGHVIYLSDGVGNIDGAYEIVSADSSTQLTISVLRADSTAEALRDVSALTVLAMAFARFYQNPDTDEVYLTKKAEYQTMAERAKERTVIHLVLEDEVIYEKNLCGSQTKLVRE